MFSSVRMRSFDDGDFDDAEEDEGLDDLENVEDVRSLWIDYLFSGLSLLKHVHPTFSVTAV